tara:strand:+ start:2415 stop:2687 length:273 start_codon:yes stop_codon:yes gene_type:complete
LINLHNAKPLCIVNCLNYGDPKDSLPDLKEFIYKLNNFCKEQHIPVIGGNVSLYNSTNDESIYPTPIVVLLALIDGELRRPLRRRHPLEI